MGRERVAIWDNLKFLLIAFVVIGHFTEAHLEVDFYKSVFLFIYSFHMPLFIFISGLFHNNEKVVKNISKYLALYIIMKIAYFLIKLIFHQKASFSLLEESGIPWFMFALAMFSLLTYLFRTINSKFLLIMAIVIACFAGYDTTIGDQFVLSRIIVFYPFYLAGTIIPHKKIEKVLEERWLKVIGCLIIGLWAIITILCLQDIFILRFLFTGRHSFPDAIFTEGPLYRLLCYLISTIVGFAWIIITPKRKLGLISIFGARTLQVYMWHQIIIYIMNYTGISNVIFTFYGGKIIWLLLAVILTIVCSLPIFSFPIKYFIQKE